MILISGISGFIGKRLAIGLSQAGYEVCGLTNKTERLSVEGVDFRVFPLSRMPLSEAFKNQKIEHVVNLAVDYGLDGADAAKLFDVNVRLPADLYMLADHFGCRSFIQTGSFSEKQDTPGYGAAYIGTKRQAHDYCHRLSLETSLISMQLEHVYGPGDNEVKLLPHVLRRLISRDTEIDLGFCALERDLIYVDDVVSAYLAVLENYQICDRKRVEVGWGKTVNLQSVVEKLVAMVKLRKPNISAELNFSDDQGGQLPFSCADTKILHALGWAPKVSLNDGLDRMMTEALEN
jgi:CDP-paratose synthetase